MTRIAITGGYGFLGWHTACRLRSVHGVEVIRIGREAMEDSTRLATVLAEADALLHLAGVNRAPTDELVEAGNVRLGQKLAEAIKAGRRPIDVVYANSVQANLDNPYGRGKAGAAEEISGACTATGGHFADLLLPNLFGEHGRPGYNSFVATFAHEVAAGRMPTVTDDRELPLLHAQDAAAALIAAIGVDGREVVPGDPRRISEVLGFLQLTHELYAQRGEIPPLDDPFAVDLFNVYRAASWPGMWPVSAKLHSDERGSLFEAIRAHGGTGQVYISTTRPQQVRGEHYHLRKVERFMVVKGTAEISLRRLLHDEVVTFRVDGESPSFIDMPTLWVHNIRNVGDEELVTMFWSDQLLDPVNPDQYPEKVATG